MRAGRPPQSATSRHYAEPIQANGGDYDELDGDYDLAGRDSTRITPRNRSSTGSSRSAPRTSTGSGDHLARFETGDY